MNKSIIFSAFNVFASSSNEATRVLRETLASQGVMREDVRALVVEWAGKRYGVEVIESKSKSHGGSRVLNPNSPQYAAARKASQRLMSAILGDRDDASKASKSHKQEVEVPAELLAAAKRLIALASQYEGGKSLASKALAMAWAK